MRNYCTCYFTRVRGWDDPFPDNLTEYWGIGLSQQAAHSYAVAALLPIVVGFPNTDVFDEGIRYLLLNRETVVGVFTSHLDGGSIAFNAFGNITTAEGLQPGETPKNKPTKWPSSDGKKTKNTPELGNVLAPAVFDTIQVLENLAQELVKSGDSNRIRVGGIILYQLGLVFTLKKTIVDALVFLEPYLESL